jgi:hypothetical protein
MALKVFTNADIDLVLADGGDAAWAAVAATWTGMDGDSGVVGGGTTTGSLIGVTGTLHDDAELPATILVGLVKVEFDWRAISTGTNPTTNFSANPADPVTQNANAGDVTGSYSAIAAPSGVFGGSDRAALFTVGAINWAAFQANGEPGSTTRIVISNFTVTVSYVSLSEGSWIVKMADMTNITGDAAWIFEPDLVTVAAVGTGTVDLPIFADGPDFVFIDGDSTPTAFADLPGGFTPDDGFAIWHVTQFTALDDSAEYSVGAVFDATIPPYLGGAFTSLDQQIYELTGMTNVKLASLEGDTVLCEMASPTAGSVFVESDSLSEMGSISFTFFIAGTYTIGGAVVTDVSPTHGDKAGGTVVTLTGTGFTGATVATFNGSSTALTVSSDTSATCVAPAHAVGEVTVSVG